VKVVVVSDSHGNIANLKYVMGFAEKIFAGAVIHCGDWNTLEAIEVVASYNIAIFTVLGNADIDPSVSAKCKELSAKFDQRFLKFQLNGRKIGVIHSIDNWKLKIENLDIVFTGHFHSQKEWVKKRVKIVRPGSLEEGVAFAVYDTDTNKVEFIHD